MTWRALAIIVAMAGVAHAQPTAADVTAAEQHQRRGSTAFDLGDYDVAIEEFKAGYELTNAPGFLYNLAPRLRRRRAIVSRIPARGSEGEPDGDRREDRRDGGVSGGARDDRPRGDRSRRDPIGTGAHHGATDR